MIRSAAAKSRNSRGLESDIFATQNTAAIGRTPRFAFEDALKETAIYFGDDFSTGTSSFSGASGRASPGSGRRASLSGHLEAIYHIFAYLKKHPDMG